MTAPEAAAGAGRRLSLQPIDQDEAFAFIARHHSHHPPPQGWKWGIAVNDGERVVGVATMGRPVAKALCDGWTIEVTRCCTDGTKHAASMLYGACRRAGRALGYKRIVTYLLKDEAGTSLIAAGWRQVFRDEHGLLVALDPLDGNGRGLTPYLTKGGSWSRPSRPRVDTHPTGQKTLWEAA